MDSDDEWEDDWHSLCDLPKGCTIDEPCVHTDLATIGEVLRRVFTGTHANGVDKYDVWYNKLWHVRRKCLCGLLTCHRCVFPEGMDYTGCMEMNGENLEAKFRAEGCMSLEDAKNWWSKYGLAQLTLTSVHRIVYVTLNVDAPKCLSLPKLVEKGTEETRLRDHFKGCHANGVTKFVVTGMKVRQQCPCGAPCDKHVLPTTVPLIASFPMEINGNMIEDKFRQEDAMSLEDAEAWFMQYPFKWQVDVKSDGIRFLLKCKCAKYLEELPCSDCEKKGLVECKVCGEFHKKRSLLNGMCQDCLHKEIIFCKHCKRKVPRGHYDCRALANCHFSRANPVYPPLLRSKNDDKGQCLDCGDIVNYRVYHRHQYRKHCYVKPCDVYTRAYRLLKCVYCNYSNYDISNRNTHMKSHFTNRPVTCRHACGKTFTQSSSEVKHCHEAHGGEGLQPMGYTYVREGDEIKLV